MQVPHLYTVALAFLGPQRSASLKWWQVKTWVFHELIVSFVHEGSMSLYNHIWGSYMSWWNGMSKWQNEEATFHNAISNGLLWLEKSLDWIDPTAGHSVSRRRIDHSIPTKARKVVRTSKECWKTVILGETTSCRKHGIAPASHYTRRSSLHSETNLWEWDSRTQDVICDQRILLHPSCINGYEYWYEIWKYEFMSYGIRVMRHKKKYLVTSAIIRGATWGTKLRSANTG